MKKEELLEKITRLEHQRGRYRQALEDMRTTFIELQKKIRTFLDYDLPLLPDGKRFYIPEDRADSDPPFKRSNN